MNKPIFPNCQVNKPLFPSYQELLDDESVAVPAALRLDTQPMIANNVIATDVWTDRGIFEKEVENLWPRVWQMVCRETALKKPGDFLVYDIAKYSILLVKTEAGELKGFHNSRLVPLPDLSALPRWRQEL